MVSPQAPGSDIPALTLPVAWSQVRDRVTLFLHLKHENDGLLITHYWISGVVAQAGLTACLPSIPLTLPWLASPSLSLCSEVI